MNYWKISRQSVLDVMIFGRAAAHSNVTIAIKPEVLLQRLGKISIYFSKTSGKQASEVTVTSLATYSNHSYNTF